MLMPVRCSFSIMLGVFMDACCLPILYDTPSLAYWTLLVKRFIIISSRGISRYACARYGVVCELHRMSRVGQVAGADLMRLMSGVTMHQPPDRGCADRAMQRIR